MRPFHSIMLPYEDILDGMLQMDVHYYNRKLKLKGENKKIGIILFNTKSETLVK